MSSLTKKQYVAVLKNLRKQVETVSFVAVDSKTVGDKYTTCSWGLCCCTKEVYPDREMHIWPDEFDKGRIAPKDLGANYCPHSKNKEDYGCFYSCYYRNLFDREASPDRAEALRRIDKTIEEATNG